MTEAIQQQNSEQSEFSTRHNDVWLIELTGGPNTECDTCDDYTYDDLTDKYWPALAAKGNVYNIYDNCAFGKVKLEAKSE